MKKITSIVALLLVLVLAACMFSSCAKKEDSTIKVYTNPEYPPFEYMEGEEATGYDIDMIKAIAEKAGFKIEIVSTQFASVITEVLNDKNAIGVSGISITDERKESVAFSEGYINAGLIVVQHNDAGFATVEDLKGKKIGVQLGTTSDLAAVEITGEDNTAQYNTFIDAMKDLQGNKIDAVIVDKPVGLAIMAELNDASLTIVDMGLQADWYGIEVNKGNTELLTKIDKALADLKAEGFFDTLDAKYFTADNMLAE